MEPVRLISNQFWGRRSGGYSTNKPKGLTSEWGWIFKIRRGGSKSSNNNGPCGHKLRWYFARAMSKNNNPIRNPEHRRKSIKEQRKAA
jgi:hypothetical protein